MTRKGILIQATNFFLNFSIFYSVSFFALATRELKDKLLAYFSPPSPSLFFSLFLFLPLLTLSVIP